MRGDFFAANNDQVRKALIHSDEYEIREDGIFRKADESKVVDSLLQLMPDSMHSTFLKLRDNVQETLDRFKDSMPDFTWKTTKGSSLLKFEKLYNGTKLDLERVEYKHLVFGFFRFSGTSIDMLGIDSLGKQFRHNLFTLGPDLRLTQYKGMYFLNFRNTDGWELMMFESWREKFLCVVPLYITSYLDEEALTETSFMGSIKNLYPGLKPIYGPGKKIRGVKGKMKPGKVLELFELSEQEFFFLKPE